MKGLLVSGGHGVSRELLLNLVNLSDIIVAADSGYRHLYMIDVLPDYVVGDFDSIDSRFMDKLSENRVKIIRHPVEKDKTDTELAIDILSDLEVKELFLVCGTGNRLDHTISNIHSLKYIHNLGMTGEVIDDNNVIRYLRSGTMKIKKTESFISLISISVEGAEISLEGFHYDLDHKRIDFGRSLGISNFIKEEVGIVSCHKGEVFVISSKD